MAKLPPIRGELGKKSFSYCRVIEFQLNLYLRNKGLDIYAEKIICPRSSLPAVAYFNFDDQNLEFIVQNK